MQTGNWTKADGEMLRHYLDGRDTSELEHAAREEYEAGTGNSRHTLSAETSNALLQRIHMQAGMVKPLRAGLYNVYKLTAAAALIIILGSVCFIEREAISNLFNPVAMVHVYTAANQEKTVTLPDGSVARMEAKSTLSYPEKFNRQTRDIKLTGEAFFKVTKDKQHPFIIHSPLVNTTVVGTEFNVDDKDSVNAKVVVVSGIVKVQATGGAGRQEVKLTPNEAAIYGTEKKLLVKTNAPDDALFYKQKRDGEFVYNGVAIGRVVKDIERYYNITVDVDETIKGHIFHGSFKTGDSVTTVLKIMAVSMNAVVKENKQGYALTTGQVK